MYEQHNLKTKSTMTDLRGLKHHLVLERTWDEEQDLELRKAPIRTIETQTIDLNDKAGDVDADYLMIVVGMASEEVCEELLKRMGARKKRLCEEKAI
jgi:hypothetical protein